MFHDCGDYFIITAGGIFKITVQKQAMCSNKSASKMDFTTSSSDR